MADNKQNCPAIFDYLTSDECVENLAGMSDVAYIGRKSDLVAPLVATTNQYSSLTFKSGKGLIKIECRVNSNKIAGESQGSRKGFNQTATVIIDAVNKQTAQLARAINNPADFFIIIPDSNDESQILYHPKKKLRVDSGGITTDTGDSPDSDRITTANLILGPVFYPHYYIEEPEAGWDSLLESAQSGGGE